MLLKARLSCPEVLIAALTVVLCQQPAAADPAEAEIERAHALIRDLHEEQALDMLAPLLANPHALSSALLARAFVYAGIAQLDLADETHARESFRAALEADAGAVLPGWVSRRIRAVFDSELAAMKPKPVKAPPELTPKPAEAPPIVIAQAPQPHPRQTWPAVAFSAGVVGAAGLAVLSNWKMRDTYARATHEPIGVDAASLNSDVVGWYGITWGLSGIVAALLAAGLALWLFN